MSHIVVTLDGHEFADLFDDPTPYHFSTRFTPPVIRDPLHFQAWVQNWNPIGSGDCIMMLYYVPIANVYIRDS